MKIYLLLLLSSITLQQDNSPPVTDGLQGIGELQDNTDSFFDEFEDLNNDDDYENENFDFQEHDYLEDDEITHYEEYTVQEQPAFFEKHGIDPKDIYEKTDCRMDVHQEVFLGKIYSTKREEELRVYATVSDGYCFFNLKGTGNYSQKFFIDMPSFIKGEPFFRTLNKECPYPPVNPPLPPVEEVCYLQAKKAQQFVEQSVSAYGEKSSSGVIICYLEALKKTKPTVETMCTEEALVAGWEGISQKEIDDLTKGAVKKYKKDGKMVYEFAEEVETVQIEAEPVN